MKQRTIFVLAEVFHAWSAMEVFVISIIAACAQISQFAGFMVGTNCDIINVVLEEAMESDSQIKEYVGDPLCFGVKASLNSGVFLLLTASIIFTLVGHYLLAACHRGLEARLHNSSEATKERQKARTMSVDQCMQYDPNLLDHREEIHPHKEEKLGKMFRNVINLLDHFKIVQVTNEVSGERESLGFGINQVHSGNDDSSESTGRSSFRLMNPIRENTKEGGIPVQVGTTKPNSILKQPPTIASPAKTQSEFRGSDNERGPSQSIQESLVAAESIAVSSEGASNLALLGVNVSRCRLNRLNSVDLGNCIDKEMGLNQYRDNFYQEGIDGAVLVALALDDKTFDDVLKEDLGIKSALHRGKVKAWVAKNMKNVVS